MREVIGTNTTRHVLSIEQVFHKFIGEILHNELTCALIVLPRWLLDEHFKKVIGNYLYSYNHHRNIFYVDHTPIYWAWMPDAQRIINYCQGLEIQILLTDETYLANIVTKDCNYYYTMGILQSSLRSLNKNYSPRMYLI